MLISTEIQKYICFSEHSIVDTLKKISDNKARIIFVVSEHGKLLGSISDGDVRRWLVDSNDLNLNVNAEDVMNKNVQKVLVGTDRNDILELFRNGIDVVPMVNSSDHLV
ncbi:hypothetical protein AKJ18_32830, partial [Vibrio xuii]